MKKHWVVNSYQQDWSWVKKYTDSYTIYDKSIVPNVGYNIYDYMHFIFHNYYNLPDTCVFIKANVFKHCREDVFQKLIKNDTFTPLESYEDSPVSYAHIKDADGGYMEINNSWYVPAHVETYGMEVCRYFSHYDVFMETMFKDYSHLDYIRFSPGANYIVPKQNIFNYTREFYEKLLSIVSHHRLSVESHIVERALFYIFTNKYKERLNEL